MDTLNQNEQQITNTNKVRSWRIPALVLLATSIALNIGIIAGFNAKSTPVIVAFDMKGTLDQFMDQSASQSLSEAQSQLLVDRFTKALDESLAEYQQQHHALILVSPSVVLGAQDITRQIQRNISARMRGDN